uniref:Uncharacterized protein n=1 Tax=Anguilla anguilla TaxID=7936 RepID=A0A0E9XB17_ANGAN
MYIFYFIIALVFLKNELLKRKVQVEYS